MKVIVVTKYLVKTLIAISISLGFEGVLYAKKEQNTCLFLLNSIGKAYQDLYKKLPRGTRLLTTSVPYRIAQLTEEGCESSGNVKRSLELFIRVTSLHSGKIGVILPMSRAHLGTSNAILTGMKANYIATDEEFQQKVVVKHSFGSAESVIEQLALLVFQDQVGIVVGGSVQSEAEALVKWSDRLMLPTLIMSKRDANRNYPKFVFNVFPNLDTLAATLVAHIMAKNYKKIAIIHPARPVPSALPMLLSKQLSERGVSVTEDLRYTSGNYTSMESVARKIFQIDSQVRAAELNDLYQKEKSRATLEGTEFNPRMVNLPPLIDIDAVFIADNFRAVRHFIKIFKYLGVKKIPLIGNQEWRADGLIEPYESFLDDAVFVDYIGSYLRLPKGLEVATMNSEFFVRPEETAKIDYRIIGHQTVFLAKQVLGETPEKRRKIPQRLLDVHMRNSPHFSNGPAFYPNGDSVWPAFLFRVSKGGIQIIPPSSKVELNFNYKQFEREKNELASELDSLLSDLDLDGEKRKKLALKKHDSQK